MNRLNKLNFIYNNIATRKSKRNLEYFKSKVIQQMNNFFLQKSIYILPHMKCKGQTYKTVLVWSGISKRINNWIMGLSISLICYSYIQHTFSLLEYFNI